MIPLGDNSWLSKYLRAGGSTPIYYVKIIKSEGTTDPDGGLVYWPGFGLAQTERWFTTLFPSWIDRLSLVSNGILDTDRMNGDSISDVVFQVDASRTPGGIGSISSFKFSLDNSNGYLKSLEAGGVVFDGRRVELWLSFYGETTRANDIQLFTGYANDPRLHNGLIEIRAEGVESRRGADMPPNIFEEETNTWETLIPQRTIGDAVPLVFGSHDMAQGKLVTDVKDDGSSNRGRAYRFVDTSIGLNIVGITNFRYGDQGLVDASGGFAEIKTAAVNALTDVTAFTVDSATGEAYLNDPSADTLYLYVDVRPKAAVHHGAYRDAQDPENALDGKEATGSLLEFTTTWSTRYGTYKIPAMALSGTIEKNGYDLGIFMLMRVALSMPSGSDCWFQTFIGEIGAAGGTNLNADKPGKNVTYEATGTWDWFSPPDAAAEVQLGYFGTTWEDWSTLQAIGKYFLHFSLFKGQTSPTSYTVSYNLFEAMLRIYFTLSIPDDGFYADVEGYADDASGTYTGTAGALIENPSHLVALILGHFAEATTIDQANHLSVATDRFGWAFARNVVDQDKVDNYLQELCEEALLFSWVDEAGASKVFPMSAPSVAPDFTLRPTDAENGILDQPNRTPLSEVVTDFVIQYKYNPIRDGYDGQFICNADESSSEISSAYRELCAWAKYNNGGVDKKKIIELRWVRDRVTAYYIAKKLIPWHTSRRWKLSWTSDLALVTVQLGDSFILEDGWLTDEPESLTGATYRVTKKRLDPSKSTIAFEAIQVFE